MSGSKAGAIVNHRHLFAALITVQAFHSLEEYSFQLWESFPPARFLSSLISSDLEAGFLVINVSVVIAGVCCYVWPIRLGWPSANFILWFWVALELANGVGHPVWSLSQGGYTPGLLTSLLLLPLAIVLAISLLRERSDTMSVRS